MVKDTETVRCRSSIKEKGKGSLVKIISSHPPHRNTSETEDLILNNLWSWCFSSDPVT